VETRTVDIFGLLRGAGIDLRAIKPDDSERAPQFFAYYDVDEMEMILVESTAKSVMAEVTCLPIDVQNTLFIAIARVVTRPGEQAILVGDKNKRGARVVRLASEDENVHRLLLTH
jgi:hypothetical protein